jgi:hypothetical protein
MERLSRSLRTLIRADMLVARIWLRMAARRSALLGLAALAGTLGLGMLNVAGYFALEPRLGPLWAAVAAALCDFAIAAALAFASLQVRPGRDLDLALELRDNAIEQLSGLARDPADLASQALMGTLTSIALRAVRAVIRRRANPKDAATK